MDKLLFKKGNSVNLPSVKEDGTFYLVEDKKEIHINDIILKNSEDIEAKLSDSYQEVEYNDKVSNLFTPANKGQKLDEAIHTVESNISVLVDEVLNNETVIATAIANISDSVGLNENLEYVADADGKYISGATSFANADKMLDEALSALGDKVSNLEQSGYDDTELREAFSGSVGLNETLMYVPNASANYISGATSMYEADTLLDNAIKALDTNKADKTEITSINDKLDVLLGEDNDEVINKFNEIVDFLQPFKETDTLEGIISGINDSINDVETSLTNSLSGYVQNETFETVSGKVESNLSAITAINETLLSKADSATTLSGYGITDAKIEDGVITLGNKTITPLTAISEEYVTISELMDTLDSELHGVAKSGSYNDLTDKPTKLSEFTNDANFIDNDTALNTFANKALSENYVSVEYPEGLESTFNIVNQGDTLEFAINTIDDNVATLVDEVVKNESVVTNAINNIANSIGLDENLNYEADETANYIGDALTFFEADAILDANIKTLSDKVDALEKSGYDDTELRNLISNNASDIDDLQITKQDILVSGDSIKTVNGESLLGNGNVEINTGVFIGTQEEYEQAYANGKIKVGSLVIILNEEDSSADTIALLGTAVLGKMILGQK